MIGKPPVNSLLPVIEQMARWTSPWANWLLEFWDQVCYWRTSPVRTVTAAYSAVLTDAVILINGDVTVTLPNVREAKNKRFTCKAINAGAGTRTVSGNGVNIDAAATWTTTTQYAKSDFVSDGTQYWAV